MTTSSQQPKVVKSEEEQRKEEAREAAKVIDLFSQGDNSLARRHDGVGLGLTFVRRVADLHDARLQISSGPGQGTVIRMVVPATRIVLAREVA